MNELVFGVEGQYGTRVEARGANSRQGVSRLDDRPDQDVGDLHRRASPGIDLDELRGRRHPELGRLLMIGQTAVEVMIGRQVLRLVVFDPAGPGSITGRHRRFHTSLWRHVICPRIAFIGHTMHSEEEGVLANFQAKAMKEVIAW